MPRSPLSVALVEGGAWVAALALFIGRADAVGVVVLVSLLLTRALALAWTRRATTDPVEADSDAGREADSPPPSPIEHAVEPAREAELRAISTELARTTAELHATTKSQDAAVEQQAERVLGFRDVIDRLAQTAADISKAAAEVRHNAVQTRDTTQTVANEIA